MLKDYVQFTPHYVTWFCHACKVSDPSFSTTMKDCLSGGRYCATDPDGLGELTGNNIVIESLREKCIFEADSDLWWTYMEAFNRICIEDTSKSMNYWFTQDCVKAV